MVMQEITSRTPESRRWAISPSRRSGRWLRPPPPGRSRIGVSGQRATKSAGGRVTLRSSLFKEHLPRTSRANRSWGVALSIVWLLVYYALLSLGKALGDKGILSPGLSLWLPNIAITLIALHLFHKAVRESPLLLQVRFEAGVHWLAQRLTPLSKT